MSGRTCRLVCFLQPPFGCKKHTYKYFELLLTEIPNHLDDKNLKFLDDLMPWSSRVQRECPSLIKQS